MERQRSQEREACQQGGDNPDPLDPPPQAASTVAAITRSDTLIVTAKSRAFVSLPRIARSMSISPSLRFQVGDDFLFPYSPMSG
jgi:hypothetical protein